jgi:hypothetical protein
MNPQFGSRHQPFSTERQDLLKMNDDAPRERSFQFNPFAVLVVGASGVGTTATLQQLARKHSEHTFMTVGTCKRLAFQSLSVALRTANARMLRSRKKLYSSLPSIPPAARFSELNLESTLPVPTRPRKYVQFRRNSTFGGSFSGGFLAYFPIFV